MSDFFEIDKSFFKEQPTDIADGDIIVGDDNWVFAVAQIGPNKLTLISLSTDLFNRLLDRVTFERNESIKNIESLFNIKVKKLIKQGEYKIQIKEYNN